MNNLKILLKNELNLLIGRVRGKQAKISTFTAGILLGVGIVGLLALYSFQAYTMMDAFHKMGVEKMAVFHGLTTALTVAVIIGIIRISAKSKSSDTELLLSMPIKKSTILIIKTISKYVFDFFFVFMLLAPYLVLYLIFSGFDVLFLLFGYVICKRYLPWRIKVVSSNGAISRKCVYRNLKTLITVLVPFLNVRGWVNDNYEDHNEFTVNAIFKVKAKGPIFGLPKSGAPYAVLLNAVKLYENKGLYVDNSQNEIQSYLDAVGDNSQTDKPSIELDYTNSSVNDVNSFGPVAQFMNR